MAGCTLGGPQNPITEITSDRNVSTTPGTAKQLTSAKCSGIVIQALETNNDLIAVGGAAVVAAAGSQKGNLLEPGQEITIYVTDADRVWYDVRTSGHGISFNLLK
jgi:hypothetical protein